MLFRRIDLINSRKIGECVPHPYMGLLTMTYASSTIVGKQEWLQSASRATIALRNELLSRKWPTTSQVDELLGAGPGNAAEKRQQGALLGVWADHLQDFVHPLFQFQDGEINPLTTQLLAALAKIPGFTPVDDPGGWRRALWLHGAIMALDNRVPAEVFGVDPQAVIAVARREAISDPNDW